MKTLLNTLCLLLITVSLCAQTTFKIEGILEDTLSNPLIYATVLLLEESDSTMVDFTRSALDGSFKFKDVESGSYLVKTTYLGYIPLHLPATSTDGSDIKLGVVQMTEMATELMEVVIKAAKAQIKMRGDTIEYDATTFKVPEGSSVEELLRKLPGMEVNQDGSLLSDGKSISKVTVDGKSFFGDNPTAATKNLPAESISKVQVFDRKSEEEEITGAISESQDKTMNLELKEDFKSGAFGRVVAGIGTEDRKEVKGNFNRFNEKIQFSIVGVGNNTGRNGLSWDDYQDFMGSQSFNFNDNTDYGFGSGMRFYSFGGSGNRLENSIQSIFFNRGQGGLPENYNGGFNFNYDHKKTKLSSVYYYNQSGLVTASDSKQERDFQSFIQNNTSTSTGDDLAKGHRVELQLEQEIDSLHTLKVKFNGAYIDQLNAATGNSSLLRDNTLTSEGEYNNTTNTTGYLVNGIAIFRKKFKKKGRSLGLNASILQTELDDVWDQFSLTTFYESPGIIGAQNQINQDNVNIADKTLFKANALYVEPLSQKFFFQTFYNFSDRVETGDRDVLDVADGQSALNGFLSRTYENKISLHRVGSSIRYSHNGFNMTTGLAYQAFNLTGDFRNKENSIDGIVGEDFNNFIPHVSINFSPVRNAYIDVNFTRTATEPQIGDLQPVLNNTNPLFIRLGNPDLTPEIKNSFSAYVSRSYPASGVRFSLNGNYGFYDNRFSQKEEIDENLVTTYQPINLEGGYDSYFYASLNFPIIKGKFTTRASLNGRFDQRPTLIIETQNPAGEILNTTTTKSIGPSLRINITPVDDVALYLDASLTNSSSKYDINEGQNQNVKERRVGVEFNSKLFAGFFLNSKFNNVNYTNDRFDADQNIPILNASIYRQFLPGKKAELRLSIYDAFNQNQGFSQSAWGNGFNQTSSVTLGRYAMLSLTYNIKGLKSGVRKDGWW